MPQIDEHIRDLQRALASARYPVLSIVSRIDDDGTLHVRIPAFDNAVTEFPVSQPSLEVNSELAVVEDDYGQYWTFGTGPQGEQGPPGDDGPQGIRGNTWFTYTGTGTPATNTFTDEIDGDLAVRTSDGEVFSRVNGVWTDQNWKLTVGGQPKVVTYHTAGPWPQTWTLNVPFKADVMIALDVSCYTTTAGGMNGCAVTWNGLSETPIADMFFNEANSHKYVSCTVIMHNVAPGSYTVGCLKSYANTTSDTNDRATWSVTMVPVP